MRKIRAFISSSIILTFTVIFSICFATFTIKNIIYKLRINTIRMNIIAQMKQEVKSKQLFNLNDISLLKMSNIHIINKQIYIKIDHDKCIIEYYYNNNKIHEETFLNILHDIAGYELLIK